MTTPSIIDEIYTEARYIFARYKHYIRQLGYQFDDVVSWVCEGMLKAMETHDPDRLPLRKWIRIKGYYHALDRIREIKPLGMRMAPDQPVETIEYEAWYYSQDDEVQPDQEDLCIIRDEVARLTDRERRVLYQKIVEEYTQVEIAADCGRSEGRISQIVRRALEKIGE